MSTALLSWCVGRYLQPSWLRWVVFTWCLILLDILTFAACLSGPLPFHLAYVLVSAQISLLILWAILSPVGWQWRLPGVLIGTAALILFAGSFDTSWGASGWYLMMLTVTAIVAAMGGGLRLFGFMLGRNQPASSHAEGHELLRTNQFGLKHLFAWATALVPLLVVARGLDFFLISRVQAQFLFPAALVALSIATVDLIAIWAVLGRGPWILRVAVYLSMSLVIAVGLSQYFGYVGSQNRTWSGGSMLYPLVRTDWMTWLWLDAALLAALLLFLRANGYLLVRKCRMQDA